MKNILISIITPTYNRAHYLCDSIESVRAQSHPNYEHIIVDDGSTDQTQQMVKKLQETDSKIKYFYIKNTGKPASVRNYGLKKAKGDYIAFLDSDDVWTPTKLEDQLAQIEKTGADIAYSYAALMDKDGKKFPNKKIIQYRWKRNGNLLLPLLFYSFIPMSTALIKARPGELLFDENLLLSEDYDLWLKLAAKRKKFCFSNKITAFYRTHEGQISDNVLKNIQACEEIISKNRGLITSPSLLINKALIKFEIRRFKFHFLAGNKLEARFFLKKAIRKDKLNFTAWILLFLTLPYSFNQRENNDV